MKENSTSCIRFGVSHTCPKCESEKLIKSGKTTTGKQRFYCKQCKKRFIIDYTYNACKSNIDKQIVLLTKEGLGIRSTARVLQDRAFSI